MKTSLLLVLVTGLSLVLTAGSCLQGKHVVGSKNYISQEVKADHFNEIKLLGSANISYHQDTRSHVEIHGSDNIIPLVETYVDGNTLMIKFKKNVSIWKGKLEIKVFAPELNKLSINGSGNIKLINGIQTSKDIEFHINGSGNIQGEGLNCRRMAVSINGSGDVRLQQIESQECQAGISGSGNINLKGKAIQAICYCRIGKHSGCRFRSREYGCKYQWIRKHQLLCKSETGCPRERKWRYCL